MRPLLLVFGMGSPPSRCPGPGGDAIPSPPDQQVVRSGVEPRVVVIHGYGATPDRIIGLMDGYAGRPVSWHRRLRPRPSRAGLVPLSSEVGGAAALGPGISTAADDLAAWLMTEGVAHRIRRW